jgi:hypothetical protein
MSMPVTTVTGIFAKHFAYFIKSTGGTNTLAYLSGLSVTKKNKCNEIMKTLTLSGPVS